MDPRGVKTLSSFLPRMISQGAGGLSRSMANKFSTSITLQHSCILHEHKCVLVISWKNRQGALNSLFHDSHISRLYDCSALSCTLIGLLSNFRGKTWPEHVGKVRLPLCNHLLDTLLLKPNSKHVSTEGVLLEPCAIASTGNTISSKGDLVETGCIGERDDCTCINLARSISNTTFLKNLLCIEP